MSANVQNRLRQVRAFSNSFGHVRALSNSFRHFRATPETPWYRLKANDAARNRLKLSDTDSSNFGHG
eukprot:15443077-Alexandrium_andersonii.AAC.1